MDLEVAYMSLIGNLLKSWMIDMTREEVKKLLPIIKAFSEGETIQHLDIINDKWKDVDEFVYHGSVKSYRIKPEPKYRPFKDAKECWQEMLKHQPFGWVVGRRDGVMYLIRCLEYVSVYTSIQYSFKDAFDKLVFADLVPFGVKIDE